MWLELYCEVISVLPQVGDNCASSHVLVWIFQHVILSLGSGDGTRESKLLSTFLNRFAPLVNRTPWYFPLVIAILISHFEIGTVCSSKMLSSITRTSRLAYSSVSMNLSKLRSEYFLYSLVMTFFLGATLFRQLFCFIGDYRCKYRR